MVAAMVEVRVVVRVEAEMVEAERAAAMEAEMVEVATVAVETAVAAKAAVGTAAVGTVAAARVHRMRGLQSSVRRPTRLSLRAPLIIRRPTRS